MNCPICTSPAHVTNSREESNGTDVRWRRYRCRSCGARFSTYEISAAEWEKVQAMRINTEKIDATIATLRLIKAQFGAANGKD